MCGFVGFMSSSGDGQYGPILQKMTDSLVHRGPDDSGFWADEHAGVGLGFRRLAVIDLSPAGHQPMISASGRYVIVFNGEIYNFRQLRDTLERETNGISGAFPLAWRGSSDTEVMLGCIEAWGLPIALDRFDGMFAFALWDRRERSLYLARDRMGEKPLYYGWNGNTFLFGSELKALKRHPDWRGVIDRGAAALFLRYNYIPKPYSIYQGIYKVLPGHFMVLSAGFRPGEPPQKQAYWTDRDTAEHGLNNSFCGTDREAVEQLDIRVNEAVKSRMVADVPLGAFLSGGVDSSLITACLQANARQPVKTFTIGYDHQAYDESLHAAKVAAYLGTEHHTLHVTEREMLDVIPVLPDVYDEPFADATQIPTILLSRMTRSQLTVAMSGEGGDELFGGYNRYVWMQGIQGRFGGWPLWAKQGLASALQVVPPKRWDELFSFLTPILPKTYRIGLPGDSLHKLARILTSKTPEAMYKGLISHWEPGELMPGVSEPPILVNDPEQIRALPDILQRMMFWDQISYLPGCGLTKTDRATMSASLEARAPLIARELVEFAWQIPMSMKVRGATGKWVLREVLQKYVPLDLIDRPKMGFAVPVDAWLRGALKEWAATLLDPGRIAAEGFFDPAPIRKKWDEHLSGKRNWAYHLWGILMFEAWLERE